MSSKIDLFLDSGAFSAHTQGITINRDDYIKFIKEHKKKLAVYANLDVIGDPEGTLENQKYLEAAGLSPLPCFHYGEPRKYLLHYMENYDYIALGGMVGVPSRDLSIWLDTIHREVICDSEGFPKVKIHGFGLTNISLLIRYPWYSVDSTSWVVCSRMGQVYVPKKVGGKYDYHEVPLKVAVSSKSPEISNKDEHISTMSPLLKKMILEYIEEKGFKLGESSVHHKPAGYVLKEDEIWSGKKKEDGSRNIERIKVRGIANTYAQRDQLNIIYFQDLEKNLPKWPWPMKFFTSSGFSL